MSECSAQVLARLYRAMLRIRRAEELIADRYKEQEMRTPTHLGIGQEAVAVGVCDALNADDVVFSHHRCHNHYLAKGGTLLGLIAELYGRQTGCSRGRGGSAHLSAPEAGVVATASILGEAMAASVGAALALRLDRSSRVAVAFFGDAAPEEGVFWESINFAALHRLGVLFVCENNLYSTESPLAVRQPAGASICDRVSAFGVRTAALDGNDVLAVRAKTLEAIELLRNGEGPVFLECATYRWREHVGPYFDWEFARPYRAREELERWQERCPLRLLRKTMEEQATAASADFDRWLREADQEVLSALRAAQAGPWPDPAALLEHAL